MPAARALRNALKARAGLPKQPGAGTRGSRARSLSNPDLRHPLGILTEAVTLAREGHQQDLLAEAEELLAQITARGKRAQASA